MPGFFCFFCSTKDFQKMALENWSVFALFLENEVQINKNNDNYGTMFLMSKQVSLPKISSCKKWKSTQKAIYAHFAQKPSTAQELTLCKTSSKRYVRIILQGTKLVFTEDNKIQRNPSCQQHLLEWIISASFLDSSHDSHANPVQQWHC